MIPGLNKRVLNFYDLMLYVALVRKHLRLMILLICMSLLVGLAVYVYSRPIYYSRSTIRVDSLSLPLDTDKVYHDGNLAAVISELKGPQVLERTAARLGVIASHSDVQTKFLRTIKIVPNTAGNLEVEVWSYIPTWPAHWTQTMVEEFMALRAEQRAKYRDTVITAYNEELKHFNDKITTDQAEKTSFQDQARFTQAVVDVTRLHDLPSRLAQIQQRIDQLNSIRQRLDDPTIDTVARLSLIASADAQAPVQIGQAVPGAIQSLSVTGSGFSPEQPDALTSEDVVVPGLITEETDWQRLDKRQRELLLEIDDLSVKYRDGNKRMVAARTELQQVQRSLEDDYQVARNRFDLILRNLTDTYHDLEKQLPDYDAANRKFNNIQEASILQQSRQLAWANMYKDAAQTIASLQYTADKEKVNLAFEQMLDLKDTAPVSPNKFKLALLSLLMGLVLAFVVPFLIEYLDYTLSNLEEVEATFQMRGLGIIPQLPSEANQPLLLDVATDGDERNLIENFRVVRTNLLAMGTLTKPAHVTMVTSAVPKEGKTVISSNLAISFSQTDARTLLMDTDLRRGRLHRLFGLRKSPGLSDYLLGKVPLDEAIRPSGKPNLSILSAGQHIDSGTELLGSPNFRELMTLLRSQYDRIIMDTPPVLGLSETSILQNQVDGVLFVIWSGRTPIRNMKTAIDILSANGANFYGFILNRLDLSTTTNYYQYYYYSSDYYHSYHALENA
jgi:capsular exopolysaccharide synthesis family protein